MTTRRAWGGRAALAMLVLIGSLGAALGPDDLAAQVRRGPPAARQEMEREVQRRFQERVRRELGLDDEQARALAQSVTAFQDERRSLLQREARLRQRLRSTGPLLSDDEAGEVLEEMAALQVEEARLLQREQARLLEVLTAPQAVRFYTLRAELGERMRRLRGGGGPGPGGGPAGPLSRGAAGTL